MNKLKGIVSLVVAAACIVAIILCGNKAASSMSEEGYFFYNVAMLYIMSLAVSSFTVKDYPSYFKKARRFFYIFLAVSAVFCFYGLGVGYAIINAGLGLITSVIVYFVARFRGSHEDDIGQPHL